MNHYEEAIFHLLSSTATVLDFRQSRRPVARPGTLKNFDFLVFSRGGGYLTDVKGKTFPSGKAWILETSLWRRKESVSDLSEIDSYLEWTSLFGETFTFLIIYPYWIKRGARDLERFEERLRRTSPRDRVELLRFRGRIYALLAVRLEDFLAKFNIGARHPRLKASEEGILLPLGDFIPEVESHQWVYSARKRSLETAGFIRPQRLQVSAGSQ